MAVRRIKIIVEYNGTGYHGWQVQNNAHTIQAEIENAIFAITGEKVRVTGAGRTDAGVHAYGQTAHFDTESAIPADKFQYALNAVLPKDIAVISSEEAGPGFHARYSATSKTYQYKVINRITRSPLAENMAWHIPEPLDFDQMAAASSFFLGTHDFSSFCSSGHNISNFTRTITVSQWSRDGDYLVYTIRGNGFLYKMVRIIVGTMVEIGLGKRSPAAVPELLADKERKKSGITAPPYGLYLVRVDYD
ncbi:MAG TPA: tRNA pseudouridine(38-40) synthase TruA [Ruminiclostridium sp.]|nr:tRNA pseudouridine(38-40) synthase TruA [Ruminiclostridium sp.]